MSQPKGAGYRNVALILSYLLWSAWVLRIVEPPTGYSPDLLYAVSTVLAWVGGIVVAALGARAANKIADRWEPGAFRSRTSPPTVDPPRPTP